MWQVHLICKSRATESRGGGGGREEGIDRKSISEAIKDQLHACREGPQHASSRPRRVADTLQGWHVLPLLGNQKPRGYSEQA